MAYRRTPAVEQRQALVRERIVRAALGLVAEQGFAGCSVSEVARRAGVATGTLYGYFANKGELLAEVFRTVSSREIAAAFATGDQPCTCQAVLVAIRTFAERALLARQLAHALLAEPVDNAVDVERLAFRQAWTELLAAHLREGIARGELPDQDADITAAALLGAVSEALVRPLGTPVPGAVDSLLGFADRSLGADHEHHPRGPQPGAAAGRARRG